MVVYVNVVLDTYICKICALIHIYAEFCRCVKEPFRLMIE